MVAEAKLNMTILAVKRTRFHHPNDESSCGHNNDVDEHDHNEQGYASTLTLAYKVVIIFAQLVIQRAQCESGEPGQSHARADCIAPIPICANPSDKDLQVTSCPDTAVLLLPTSALLEGAAPGLARR